MEDDTEIDLKGKRLTINKKFFRYKEDIYFYLISNYFLGCLAL
jgi:hypothetical protein